jgi:L-fuculose-phosphate aldolase
MAYAGNGKNNGREFVSEFKLKEQMCDIGRRIWIKGFCAGNEGNHTYRLGPDRILCTPSLISKGSLKPDDMCIVDMDGKQVSGKRKRTSEILLHLAVYSERDDVKAVIHSHPPHATAFAIADIDLPTCIHPEAEVFLGPVKTAKYVTPGDKRLGESIKPFIKESNTILLGNHGVVCYGSDLEDAYYKLEIVDAYARILLLVKQLGSVRPLGETDMKELLDLKKRIGFSDPRTAPGASMSCSGSDYMSRVSGDYRTVGRMETGSGTTAVRNPAESSTLATAVEQLLPSSYNESDLEQLVQSITDQIMASA